MDNAIFNVFRRVQAEKDPGKRAQLMAETNAELGQHFNRHPAELEELAFDLVNIAYSDVIKEDIVPNLIEVKTVGLADVDYVEEDLRGGRAYWQGKGGQIESDIIRYERFPMPRLEMVTALDFHLDEITTDFWGSFAKLSGQAKEKLRSLPVTKLVELIQGTVTSGDFHGTFAGASLTDAQVDSILDNVLIKANGKVSIVGTRLPLKTLAAVGVDFGNNVAERVFNTGQIGVYKGVPVVQVENSEDFDGNFILPNDELWLIGQNAGRLTYYGAEAKVQQLQLPSFMRRWETARDAGMLLYGAERGRVGRITLT